MSSITELNLDDLIQSGPSIFYNGHCIVSTDTDVNSPAANEQLAKSIFVMIKNYTILQRDCNLLLQAALDLADENDDLYDQLNDMYEDRYGGSK